MKITFNIIFHTVWGQSLFITGSDKQLGAWNTSNACPMQYTGDGNWSLDIVLPDDTTHIEYRYFLSSNGKLVFEEWQKNHFIEFKDNQLSYILYDYWQNTPTNIAYYSSAFTKSFFAHSDDKTQRTIRSGKKITIKILAPQVRRNQSLALSGNQEEFGNWDVKKPLILSSKDFPLWEAEINAEKVTHPIEFKLLILDNKDRSLVCWENGDNRVLNLPLLKPNETAIVSGIQFRDENPDWKCAGLVIPVFSLRSSQSFGIGDLADLKKMVDWVRITNQKMIQILPINDTTMTHTWMDSYPYNAISIFALHPLYLSLQKMGVLNDPVRKKFYSDKQKELNASSVLDYEVVDQIKWAFFREIFEQEGKHDLSSDEFKRFFESNKEWLIPYAAFSYLRDKNQTSNFKDWGDFAKYNAHSISELCKDQAPLQKETELFYYIQFHLHKQLSEVRDYAYSNGIVLKGDIPIGISKASIEAWKEPKYFNMKTHAGAPPDDFSLTGQNWGFPTYNWDEMEKDNYAWWKKRFQKMSDYFDAYRIDHILGFFRIWEIPQQSIQGLYAWFSPSLPFSIKEIENAGIHFDKLKLTIPHINEKFLRDLFGDYTSEVKDIFLEQIFSRHFTLKKKFDTQLKIQTYFAGKNDTKSEHIRNGLYAIANEVLFIPDPKNGDTFHPRISASNSYLYRELTNSDRYAFDYLYWNYFYQRHNEFWKEQGFKHLMPLISSTDMLVCGEDLGMIPQSVPEVMHRLQILSLEIERMPKEINTDFTNLKKLPYLSVCTTSTHDMSTIRGWWKENRQKTQEYYNRILQRDGIAPEECTTDICNQILMNHLNAPSMLTIIPLQDWLSIDENIRRPNVEEERINIPANPRHYWKYRMHICIEDLIHADELNDKIRMMIKKSGREQV